MLISDLATLFTRRTIEIEVFLFSFSEFCDYFEQKNIIEAFELYTEIGGMSGSYIYDNEIGRISYLKNVYETILLRVECELNLLLSIRDAYPKILIANTKHPMTFLEGIPVYDIARWLLGNQN